MGLPDNLIRSRMSLSMLVNTDSNTASNITETEHRASVLPLVKPQKYISTTIHSDPNINSDTTDRQSRTLESTVLEPRKPRQTPEDTKASCTQKWTKEELNFIEGLIARSPTLPWPRIYQLYQKQFPQHTSRSLNAIQKRVKAIPGIVRATQTWTTQQYQYLVYLQRRHSQWDDITTEYNRKFPNNRRNRACLKRKWLRSNSPLVKPGDPSQTPENSKLNNTKTSQGRTWTTEELNFTEKLANQLSPALTWAEIHKLYQKRFPQQSYRSMMSIQKRIRSKAPGRMNGHAWTPEELQSLVDLKGWYFGWEDIAKKYNEIFPNKPRTRCSLKEKWRRRVTWLGSTLATSYKNV